MQQYPLEKQYWEMNPTERAEASFLRDIEDLKKRLANNDGKPLTPEEKSQITSEINSRLKSIGVTGWIQSQINLLGNFKNKSAQLEERQLRWEKHCSTRLGDNLRRAGKMRPDSNCQAHAIIAGKDQNAGEMRAMLAAIGIRVDDPCNGAWLPAYEKHLPHWAMPNAVCHAWLNHAGYHRWLAVDIFTEPFILDADESSYHRAVSHLNNVATRLQYYGDKIPKTAIKTKADTANRAIG